ncbi:MAG: cupin domain-containing protein [Saprospiraceae bacterium]
MNLHGQKPLLASGVYAWDQLLVKKSEDREVRKLMEGSTTLFEYLEIHATTQYKGAKPRLPHAQKDLEEIILVKEGTMKFTMDDKDAILGPGSVILIPPLAMQALENIGNGSLTYYVLMFRSNTPMDMERSKSSGGPLFVNADDLVFKSNVKGGRIDYINRPTAMCENAELHVTQLNVQGPSHKAHKHIDSEMILVIEGEIDVVIEGVPHHGKAGDLFLIHSNEMHGIQNTQNKQCKYFALRWK